MSVDVIGDLNGRRGQIQGQEARGIAVVINAMVPLANMFKYVDTLRSMSQGRAQYTMQFDHYEPVPQRGRSGNPEEIRVSPDGCAQSNSQCLTGATGMEKSHGQR